ncbi:hypothetical protein ISF_04846 [Cordyceps fumosorosea ARSEF 2679]|uniref:Uncharacterized protein n=1 Tax=Cordyceps fumosorosea (strain ARSEF 2679) TaxID=1081104 RepID=A0A167VTP5_CORFA|nr:hypothetical protein ISF_04846 [Cordyceps fumosorosea ARSEF 2679]OAA62970.1 hypothetical protein ISF_04846 [Cordyceps fumosorosea ARSEF 2679]
MPDKSGALLIVADDEDSWMQVYQSLNSQGRSVRNKSLPKRPSKGFRFLAWSAGMPPQSSYIRKTSDILPENTWFDGTHLRYKESNPRYRWIAPSSRSRQSHYYDDEEDEDDDDDDDDGCGHAPPGKCCQDCAVRCLGWRDNDKGLQQDEYGNWWDGCGNLVGNSFVTPGSRPCQNVNYSLPASRPPRGDWRGRRFARMPSPVGGYFGSGDDDDFTWQDGPSGRVRYTKQLMNPVCNSSGGRPGGVEQYRCG